MTRETSISLTDGHDAVTWPNVKHIRIMGPPTNLAGDIITGPEKVYWAFTLERPGKWWARGRHPNSTFGNGFVIYQINNMPKHSRCVIETHT